MGARSTTRRTRSSVKRLRGRHVPAAVKRAVWSRDQGRCAFAGPHGRCSETGFLEYHHVAPFAAGGATEASNLELRCRAHNAYEATVWFGKDNRPDAKAPGR
jgi:5-methylcytosine-specific restriction endonuclease McrA